MPRWLLYGLAGGYLILKALEELQASQRLNEPALQFPALLPPVHVPAPAHPGKTALTVIVQGDDIAVRGMLMACLNGQLSYSPAWRYTTACLYDPEVSVSYLTREAKEYVLGCYLFQKPTTEGWFCWQLHADLCVYAVGSCQQMAGGAILTVESTPDPKYDMMLLAQQLRGWINSKVGVFADSPPLTAARSAA